MTDILIAMHCQEHLVAVSNYDLADSQKPLPRVGDYLGPDWETLATVHADLMIVQAEPSRIPHGLVEKSSRLGMKLQNVKLNTVADVLYSIESIGEAIGENDKALQLKTTLGNDLNQVRNLSAGQPKIRVLMILDETAHAIVGDGNFLDNLLTMSGGENVAKGMGAWPTGDMELVLVLKPDMILSFRPNTIGDAPAAIKKNLRRLTNVPAISNGHVYAMTDRSVLMPGAHIGQTALSMQQILSAYRSSTTGKTAQ